MSTPVRLSDSELDQVFRAAAPLPAHARDRFLQTVASKLAGVIIGPGVVYKACLETQRELMDYPQFGSGHWSKHA